jgi:small-conductance mechanosensitive channel
VEVSVNVHRMFFESLERQAFQDAGMLILGYFIVFVYVFLMLGKFNWVEQRFYLSVGGVMGIAIGIFAR